MKFRFDFTDDFETGTEDKVTFTCSGQVEITGDRLRECVRQCIEGSSLVTLLKPGMEVFQCFDLTGITADAVDIFEKNLKNSLHETVNYQFGLAVYLGVERYLHSRDILDRSCETDAITSFQVDRTNRERNRLGITRGNNPQLRKAFLADTAKHLRTEGFNSEQIMEMNQAQLAVALNKAPSNLSAKRKKHNLSIEQFKLGVCEALSRL
jgi:hypothetical protein